MVKSHDEAREFAMSRQVGWKTAHRYFRSKEWECVSAKYLAKHPGCAVCGFRACRAFPVAYTTQALLGDNDRLMVGTCFDCTDLFFNYYRKPMITQLQQAIQHNQRVLKLESNLNMNAFGSYDDESGDLAFEASFKRG